MLMQKITRIETIFVISRKWSDGKMPKKKLVSNIVTSGDDVVVTERTGRKLSAQEYDHRILVIKKEKNITVVTKFEEFTKMPKKTQKVACVCNICLNKWTTRFQDVASKVKNGCPVCSTQKRSSGLRHTEKQYKDIVRKIKQEKKIVVHTEYKDYKTSKQFVSCVCLVCGHRWGPRFNSLKQGFGCKVCAIKTNAKKMVGIVRPNSKKDYKEEVDVLSQRGITVLSKERPQRKDKVDFLCDVCGHIWTTRFEDVLRRTGCPKCVKKITSSAMKNKEEWFTSTVQSLEKEKQIICRSAYADYTNFNGLLSWLCTKCGVVFDASLGKLLGGQNCQTCSRKACADRQKITLKKFHTIEQNLLKQNIKILFSYSEYENIDYRHNFMCLKCNNIFVSTLYLVSNGQQCCPCDSYGTSKAENEICNFMNKTLVINTTKRSRVLRRDSVGKFQKSCLEIDIFVQNLMFGVEYHGNYWHSSEVRLDSKEIHREKYDLAQKAGIDLIQIFQDEYNNNPDLIHSIIRYKVGKPMYRLDSYADCYLGSTSDREATEFVAANSFETYNPEHAKLAMYSQDTNKPVAMLIWHLRGEDIWFRYIVARDMTVENGLAKMLKCIRGLVPNATFETDSDARYSLHDKELLECGFVKTHMTEPEPYLLLDNYKTRKLREADDANEDGLPEIYGVGFNVFRLEN